MKNRLIGLIFTFFFLLLSVAAQTSSANPAPGQVPPLIQFSGVATEEGGNYLTGNLEISFSIYAGQLGGEPLWSEVQNVQPDRDGYYAVQLGITKPSGVPAALFSAGQPRWLGVRINEQSEQPRVLLVSVPYAMKAGDAATIGGLPPSAFVLAAPPAPSGETVSSFVPTSASTVPAEEQASTTTGAVSGGGTADFIPLWTSGSVLGNSVLFQTGSGSTARIGINTTSPSSTLGVNGAATIGGLTLPASGTATASSGMISHPLNLVASTFNSSTSKAVNQTFRWQTESAGNDTASPSGTLNLLFGSGTTTPAETGLTISSNGVVTFAATQILPGADVTGDLGDSGQIVNINATNIISAPVAQFSSSLLVPTINAAANITAGGAVTAASESITGSITGGSIVTTGTGSFSSIIETGDISSFGNISASQASFENNSTFETLDLQNLATPANSVFLEAQFNNASKAIVWTDAEGDFNAVGTKSAVVPANDGSMIKLFAVESPQVWFDDYGSGQLSRGAATVLLEAAFAQTVNTSAEYHVFLTPKGDCKGLYVINETATGFEVKELGGGTSSVAFDYRIVALRKGYENVRLPVTPVPQLTMQHAVRQTKRQR